MSISRGTEYAPVLSGGWMIFWDDFAKTPLNHLSQMSNPFRDHLLPRYIGMSSNALLGSLEALESHILGIQTLEGMILLLKTEAGVYKQVDEDLLDAVIRSVRITTKKAREKQE